MIHPKSHFEVNHIAFMDRIRPLTPLYPPRSGGLNFSYLVDVPKRGDKYPLKKVAVSKPASLPPDKKT
jgi:hypothetical protein